MSLIFEIRGGYLEFHVAFFCYLRARSRLVWYSAKIMKDELAGVKRTRLANWLVDEWTRMCNGVCMRFCLKPISCLFLFHSFVSFSRSSLHTEAPWSSKRSLKRWNTCRTHWSNACDVIGTVSWFLLLLYVASYVACSRATAVAFLERPTRRSALFEDDATVKTFSTHGHWRCLAYLSQCPSYLWDRSYVADCPAYLCAWRDSTLVRKEAFL